MRAFVLLLGLAACSGGGNLSAAGGQHGPTPPPIRNPYFDPYVWRRAMMNALTRNQGRFPAHIG